MNGYRYLLLGCLILTVFIPTRLPAEVTGSTHQIANGKTILNILQASSSSAVPPQDILVINSNAFGDLPEKTPAEMEQIVRFFDELPTQVNLHAYRGQDRDGTVIFGPLRTNGNDSFLQSLEVEGAPVRDPRDVLRNLVDQWPGSGDRPGAIVMLTRNRPRGSFEITPELLKSLYEEKILVHHLTTAPGQSRSSSSTAQLARLSGGFSISTGDVLAEPWLPGSYRGDSEYENWLGQRLDSTKSGTDSRWNVGELYRRTLEQVLPIHAYQPRVVASNGTRAGLQPEGYAWSGRMPLVVSISPPVGDLVLHDGNIAFDSVQIPRQRPERLRTEETRILKHLKRLSLARRDLIHGLNAVEQSWQNWLEISSEREQNRRPADGFATDFISFLTGRVAIGESFQLDDWQTTEDDRARRTVPIESVDPPALQHLDYAGMMEELADTVSIPLAEWAPEDMAVLSFNEIDSALVAGDIVEYWSGDVTQNYMGETGGDLLKKRLLDRLGIAMNREMRPFYKLAVDEIGFFLNEPSLGATQDVALVMSVENRELVETRLDQIRSRLSKTYPEVSRNQEQFMAGGAEQTMTVFRSPDRSVSSYTWFDDGGVVIGTSKRTVERIARVKTGESPALKNRDDVRYLSRVLDPASGYMVISDSFVSKIVQPAWRMKYDRRARCLKKLDLLAARTSFRQQVFGSVDRSPRVGLCSPEHEVTWEDGHWVSPVYGHRQFATPISELSISKLTDREHDRYRRFVEQYQRQWRTAVDPIGISLDLSSDRFLEMKTVILPLVNQSQYNQLFQIVQGSVSSPLENWQSLPSNTVFGALFANPYAQYEQGRADTAANRFRQWERYKQRLRSRLDWPADEPMLDWLGSEWGLVSFDLAPEDLAGLFSDNPMSAVTRVFSEVPIALYTDVRNESKANYFLEVVKQSRDARGRAGFRLREQTVDDRTIYTTNLFGVPLYMGVRDGKLFLSLSREFLVPLEDSSLATRTNFTGMSERFHQQSQGLFFFQLGDAVGLKRFLNPSLYPMERYECRRQRAQYDTHHNPGKIDRRGPFGGEWFRGPGGNTFCSKHSSFTNQTLWERLLDTGKYPVLSAEFPLKKKLDQLDNVIISFEISPVEYSVIMSMETPLAK